MKLIIILIFISILLPSCAQQQEQKQQKKRIQKDGYMMEGNIENDSIFQGVINYYDINTNKLVYQATFLNNVKNGLAINYYPNGVKQDKVFFVSGKKNGEHIGYDSTGKITYKDYYYYGKQLGPISFYKEDGSIKEYYFVNFEGETLLYRSYVNLPKKQEDPRDYFYMYISEALENEVKKIEIFLYIIQLPKFSFKYSICMQDSNNHITHIKNIPNDQVFYQAYLSPLVGKQNYCITLNVFDSTTQKNQVIIKEILLDKLVKKVTSQ